MKTIYIAMIILTIVVFLATNNIAAAQNAKNDLIVMIKDAKTNPTIAKFALNGTNYPEICQSGKCSISFSDSSPYSTTPTPDNQFMSYSIDFKIIDNAPQKNIGPIKREFLEKFASALFACKVDGIQEDNEQELYYCHDRSGAVTRSFDSKSWFYDMTGIYDAKANTLTFIGNYSNAS